jgi:5-methylcytosine-specific restriction endonuclease McrA
MHSRQLKSVSNHELVKQLERACADANALTVRIIHLLNEVEERSIYLREACSSMFDYCVRHLRMSEGVAYLRLAAARLVQKFPSLARRIERGDIHLSGLLELRKHLTAENYDELVDAVRGMSKRQIIEFLMSRERRAVQPPGPAKLRKLPKMKTANAIAPTLERELELIAEMQYRLGITLDRAERDELLFVRDLMMHRNPSGDLKNVVMDAVRKLRLELEREVLAKTSRPRSAKQVPPLAKTTGEIPRPVRRAVFERDGHRCTFTSEKGERCPATAMLQLDHIVSPLHGGTNEPSNLRVRCRAHNLLHAENVFGKKFVRDKIRTSQLESKRKSRLTSSPDMDMRQAGETKPSRIQARAHQTHAHEKARAVGDGSSD